jgi:hypothetical protein
LPPTEEKKSNVGVLFMHRRVWVPILQHRVKPTYDFLRFKINVMFGHKLHYEIKVTFGEISLKLCQTKWNVAKNNVNVVVGELPSQITLHLFNN